MEQETVAPTHCTEIYLEDQQQSDLPLKRAWINRPGHYHMVCTQCEFVQRVWDAKNERCSPAQIRFRFAALADIPVEDDWDPFKSPSPIQSGFEHIHTVYLEEENAQPLAKWKYHRKVKLAIRAGIVGKRIYQDEEGWTRRRRLRHAVTGGKTFSDREFECMVGRQWVVDIRPSKNGRLRVYREEIYPVPHLDAILDESIRWDYRSLQLLGVTDRTKWFWDQMPKANVGN